MIVGVRVPLLAPPRIKAASPVRKCRVTGLPGRPVVLANNHILLISVGE